MGNEINLINIDDRIKFLYFITIYNKFISINVIVFFTTYNYSTMLVVILTKINKLFKIHHIIKIVYL